MMSTKYYCVSGFKPSWLFLYIFNRVYCIHVSGHDPLILSFRFLFLFDWVGVLCPQLSKVLKPVCWASLFPQCPCRGRLFVSAAGVHVFISGEILHCFLVGVQIKSYVIATSDSSSMLPTFFPHSPPRSPTKPGAANRIGSRRVTTNQGTVERSCPALRQS